MPALHGSIGGREQDDFGVSVATERYRFFVPRVGSEFRRTMYPDLP